jgi:hypothetical protein
MAISGILPRAAADEGFQISLREKRAALLIDSAGQKPSVHHY